MAIDIISRGNLADELLSNETFLTLWDELEEEIAKDILKTALDEEEKRKMLFLAYHGGRLYVNMLTQYRNERDLENMRRKQKEEDEPQEDE